MQTLIQNKYKDPAYESFFSSWENNVQSYWVLRAFIKTGAASQDVIFVDADDVTLLNSVTSSMFFGMNLQV